MTQSWSTLVKTCSFLFRYIFEHSRDPAFLEKTFRRLTSSKYNSSGGGKSAGRKETDTSPPSTRAKLCEHNALIPHQVHQEHFCDFSAIKTRVHERSVEIPSYWRRVRQK